MALSKKFLEMEIEKARIALVSLEEQRFLHESVKRSLEEELSKIKSPTS